ncbi:hypothetical protein FOPG_19580 [Fusarium oxysporum f. sp. conglutinans race 2 54008]|uniref:Uncharacterized protein n=2 Tax=Fusarium oxysporum f. sp. conglutinans TaxID=100902 RepID=F9GDP4_FUSOF|nr:hypothetical protein FOXB_16778 [Fusarium oxysporum f. sp. conglutinans Fo5176]EXL64150.1 hypothetical protein FOPG_19580 [Fusarium oxysporum f. sp. conglutinans race 2 54008]KAG6989584.1 hypothetical protein FocnCong_v020981 [Fusarium oxysporum f. sp. conglutinans]KAI8404304.1 hypothetical protein FOFC_15799 [Fusarium oxysporum]
MPIDLFSVAGEIRNKVYEELLSASERIIIESGPRPPRLYMIAASRLYSAILLVNKRANREASPLLYSRSQFEFGIDWPGTEERHETKRLIFASFISQIGLQNASFLRHLCIPFSASGNHYSPGIVLEENSMSTLKLFRDKCTGITTLNAVFETITAEMLAVMYTSFSSMPTLKYVNIITYDGLLSDELIEKICNWGWTAEIVQLDEEDDDYDYESDDDEGYYWRGYDSYSLYDSD